MLECCCKETGIQVRYLLRGLPATSRYHGSGMDALRVRRMRYSSNASDHGRFLGSGTGCSTHRLHWTTDAFCVHGCSSHFGTPTLQLKRQNETARATGGNRILEPSFLLVLPFTAPRKPPGFFRSIPPRQSSQEASSPPKTLISCRGLELFPRALAALQAATAPALQAALNAAAPGPRRGRRREKEDLYRRYLGSIELSSTT